MLVLLRRRNGRVRPEWGFVLVKWLVESVLDQISDRIQIIQILLRLLLLLAVQNLLLLVLLLSVHQVVVVQERTLGLALGGTLGNVFLPDSVKNLRRVEVFHF